MQCSTVCAMEGPSKPAYSHQDKRVLVKRLSDMPSAALQAVVHLVRRSEPENMSEIAEGWDIHVDKLSDTTLRSLDEFWHHLAPSDSFALELPVAPAAAHPTASTLIDSKGVPVPPAPVKAGSNRSSDVELAESLMMIHSSGPSLSSAAHVVSGSPSVMPTPPPEPPTLVRRQSLRSASSKSGGSGEITPLFGTSLPLLSMPPPPPVMLKKQDSFVNNPELRRMYDVIQLVEAKTEAKGDKSLAKSLLPMPSQSPQALRHSDSFGDYYPLGPDAIDLEKLAEDLPDAKGELLAIWACPACQQENVVCVC